MKPAALLIHVPDVDLGLKWYQEAFPLAKSVRLQHFDFTTLNVNGFLVEIVQADEKVSEGKQGTVLYWLVDEVVRHLEALGAKLYRGPIPIEDGLFMCQLEDPFGNLIGLRGLIS